VDPVADHVPAAYHDVADVRGRRAEHHRLGREVIDRPRGADAVE
jgi:hypothetical protein